MEALTAEIVKQTYSSTSVNASPSSSSSTPSHPTIDKSAIASFFISVIGGNTEAAEYLYDILNLVDPLYIGKKRSIDNTIGKVHGDNSSSNNNISSGQMLKSAKLEEGEITPEYNPDNNIIDRDSNFDILKEVYINDEVDDVIITFAIQIPNDQSLASAIIGKSGENIVDIKRSTGVKTTVENIQPNVYQKDRAIFFMGECKKTLVAYQKMLKKVIVKNEEKSPTRPGIPQKIFERDPLVVIIPNEMSARIIGKGGSTIRNIQANCGAKTSIEKEEQMNSQYSYGRRIFITGTIKQKIHAAYLIVRFLAHECYHDLDISWKGHVPPALIPPPPVPPPPPPPLPPPPFAGYTQRGYPTDRHSSASSHSHVPQVQYQQHYNQYSSVGYNPQNQQRR